MSILNPSPAVQKRSRDDTEGQSPGKRVRTWTVQDEQPQVQLPPPPLTPNFTTTLAQQQQLALEQMSSDAMDREDVKMGADMAMGNEITSNPEHPWNAAPRMLHQLSNSSLYTSSWASGSDSSMPTTPLDLPLNEQAMHNNPFAPQPVNIAKPTYPSSSNPSCFTDMNGQTRFFSSSPPLSVYPPPPTPSAFEMSNPFESAAFPMHAGGATASARRQPQPPVASTTSGVMRMDTPRSLPAEIATAQQQNEVVRELHQPVYGWDMPKQASTLNFGGTHLI
ncbi:hypothetical protein JCM11641_005182 [Rhodosporidiobolus odoratus]